MQTLPRISIVTPSYNQASFIEKTIQSVLGQHYPDLEYWIIDGGSTDGTVDILKKYGDTLQWVSEPDKGQSDAINKGIAKLSGDLFVWLNSDDVLADGALAAVAETYKKLNSPTMIYGLAKFIDENDKDLGFCGMHSSVMTHEKLLSGSASPIQPACFVPLATVKQIGGVDTNLHYSMDLDFFIRLSESLPFSFVNQVIAYYRLHQQSKTVAYTKGFIHDIPIVYDKAFRRNSLTLKQRDALSNLVVARKYLVPDTWDLGAALRCFYEVVINDIRYFPTLAFILMKALVKKVFGMRLWSFFRYLQQKVS